jgi:enoyl-CoA hydratase/carnithine racemase
MADRADPVTRFHVRRVGTRTGPVALVTIDNGADWRKPSTFGREALESLAAALDLLEAGDWSGLVLTGKPLVFAAGADVSQFPGITPELARRGSAAGHELFGRLRALPYPTVAAINGAALGGGLEIALHCDYRTIATSVRHVAFPEVFLGLVPGWGGTQLAPRLLGAEKAVQLLVDNPLRQNRMLTGPEAFELGLADHLLDPVELVDESLALLAGIVEEGRGKRTLDAPLDDAAEVCARARASVDDQVHGAAPAPYRALDLVAGAAAWTVEEGYRAEEDTLAELLPGPEGQASIYAFDVVERRLKRGAGVPETEPRRVQRVGIAGAGLMATQLATLFLRRLQAPVVIGDVDRERAEQARVAIGAELEKLAARGRLPEPRARFLAGSVTVADGPEAYAGCDLVLEAVFEELDVKRRVLAELEEVVPETCLLATNTSSLSVGAMADGLRRPERVAPLLQPRRGAPPRGGRPRRSDRGRGARDRLGRDRAPAEARRARPRRAGVRRQPHADPAVVRALRGRREREHVRGDRRGGAAARVADAAVGAARDGRATRGEPRPADAARGVPRPFPALADAAEPRRR